MWDLLQWEDKKGNIFLQTRESQKELLTPQDGCSFYLLLLKGISQNVVA